MPARTTTTTAKTALSISVLYFARCEVKPPPLFAEPLFDFGLLHAFEQRYAAGPSFVEHACWRRLKAKEWRRRRGRSKLSSEIKKREQTVRVSSHPVGEWGTCCARAVKSVTAATRRTTTTSKRVGSEKINVIIRMTYIAAVWPKGTSERCCEL